MVCIFEYFCIHIQINFIFVCAAWYLSLNATISAINNTLFQSSVCIVYILSVLFLPNYSMSWMKNMSVVLCMIGVILIGWQTQNQSDKDQKDTWYGYVEEAVSVIVYAVVEVYISIVGKKHFEGNNHEKHARLNKVNSKLLMEGMMGVICFLTLWPGIFLLNWTEIEVFELPTARADILCVVVTAAMDCVYVAAFIIGITLTNPVVMAVAQLLIIPISFLWDALFNGLNITLMGILGTMLILIGFLLMELPIHKYIKRLMNKEEENIIIQNI